MKSNTRAVSKLLGWIACLSLALAQAVPAWGQETPSAGSQDGPDDLLSRPTQHGFRLTPSLAQMMARRWLQVEVSNDVTLTARQEEELSRRVADRLMGIADNNGEQVRDMIEYTIEAGLNNKGGPLSAEELEELGKRGRELTPVIRDFFRGFARDARPLLTEKQWEAMKDRLRNDFRYVNRYGQIMDRWSEGDIAGNEDFFHEMSKVEEQIAREQAGDAKRSSNAVKRARRRAEADVRKIGTVGWEEFLRSSADFFKFTDEQMAKGKEILTLRRREAEALRSLEWQERVRMNRIKYHLRWSLGRESSRVWVFSLEREYNELVAPVVDLQNRFEDEIIALSTPEQRQAAIEPLRERTAEHGLGMESLDVALLEVAPPQP